MIKLIAFLDGSIYSKSVCEYAAWIAAKVGGSVDLVHVLGRRDESDAPVDLSGSIGLGARTALLEELAELDGQMARLGHKRGRAILEEAKDFNSVKRALIAFDGGASALKAVNYLARNQAFNDIECHLLSVTDASSKANKKLESAAALLRDAGYTVGTTVQAGQPEAVICEKIKTGQFDLLLMGAYGHSHIRNLIIGSTTTAMIRSCKIPVLLFR